LTATVRSAGKRLAPDRVVSDNTLLVVAEARLVVGEEDLPTNSRRLRTPVFSKMFFRCSWTVCGETTRRSAIWDVASPEALGA